MGGNEGVLAAQTIAEHPEHDRPNGPDHEAHAEGGQGKQEAGRRTCLRKEKLAEKHGEGAVDVEVVPLEKRPQG